MALLRTALTLFGGFLLYGILYFFALDRSIPQRLVIMTLILTGLPFKSFIPG